MRGRAIRLAFWIVLGLALRFAALGGDGLWCDEGYTAWTAHLTGPEHEAARRHDDAPPLYYALQRAVVPHLPPDEAAVRLVSAAAGVAGIVWLAVAPPLPALVEAPVAFLAAGTYGVYYGRQARSYTLLFLWGLVLMTATWRVLEGKQRWLPVVALAEALALWTHNVAATLVVGANLAWLLCGRRDARRWLVAQAAAFVLWLPYLIRALPQFAAHAELNRWIGDYWTHVPLLAAPLLSLASFTSGARVTPAPPAARWFYGGAGATVLSILAFATVAALLVLAFRRRMRREALFAACFTLGPLVAMMLLSLVTTPSYILARTDAVAYGGFLLWAAVGFTQMPRAARIAAAVVLAAITALAMATSMPIAGHGRGNDRIVGERLREAVRPGDWVVFVGLSRPSIDYYLSGGRPGRPDPSIRRVAFPAIFADNPAAVYPIPGDSLRAWEREALRLRARFEADPAAPESRLWFVGPIRPDAARDPTAADLTYPGSILAYVVNGLRRLDPVVRLRGDGMGIDWLLFGVRRDALVPREELEPIEAAP